MPICASKINPCLWFDTEAEEAARFYCSIFKNSKVGTIRWVPYEATEAERMVFEDGKDSMTAGWTGTFDRLDSYLARA
jgi:predicted 3-demethylubiquinone-9 3-methyltransferase (glyoxalase superfamily)